MSAAKQRSSGWWEQDGYGRQPMHDLVVRVAHDRIFGAGVDVVGRFDLTGELERDGTLEITKRYIGRHTVPYRGWHDGEGRLWGHWSLWGWSGRWLIVVGRDDTTADDDLAEFVTLTAGGKTEP